MGRSRKKKLLLEQIGIEDIAAEGKALAHHEGTVVFTRGAVPGDVVDIQVSRKRKAYMEGHVVQFHRYSDTRTDPFCRHFGTCGGCKWQMLPYEKQLFYKQKQVRDQLQRIGHLSEDELALMQDILPSPDDRYYRNKMEYTFSANRWLEQSEIDSKEEVGDRRGMGFHIPGRFDKVLDLTECHLQMQSGDRIRQWFRNFSLKKGYSYYDLKEQKGFLRTLIIRTALSGELMVIVTVRDKDEEAEKELFAAFLEAFPEVNSLLYVHNLKGNDTIYDQEVEVVHGREYILEEMGELQFKVGPKSFYQPNPRQAHELYKTALQFAGLSGEERVYDLYTGTGTIACFLAARAKQVIGIENVPEAVEDARFNAQMNGIENVKFHTGDMSKVLTADFFAGEGRPDVVVMDPPRAGVAPEVLERLLEAAPERIVYISCNPATQARDIALLKEGYTLKAIQPVDMFPQTHHVENVVLLERKA